MYIIVYLILQSSDMLVVYHNLQYRLEVSKHFMVFETDFRNFFNFGNPKLQSDF